MAKRKKLTKLQSEFRKNQQRIQRYIRKYEKQGYIIDIQIPEMPKRVTQKQLRLIKEINPKYIQSRSIVPDVQTGEIISGTDYQKLKRQRSRDDNALKDLGYETSYSSKDMSSYEDSMLVINTFLNSIREFPPKVFEKINTLIQKALHTVDPEDVAQGIQVASPVFKDLAKRLAYGSDKAIDALSSAIINFIPNITIGERDDLELAFYEAEYVY